jgi:hypothetical protein
MFSCSIEMLFIRHRHASRSFVLRGCTVLHYSGVSEYHVVAMVTAVKALDVV